MKYQGFLVGRYLRSRIIPLFAVVAVAFGVFALITVLAVMEGFKHEMRRNIRGTLSHLVVKAEGGQPLFGEDSLLEEIRKLDHVVGATPFFEGVGLWKSNRLSNCIFRGIDPKTESSVSDLATYLLRDEELPALLEDRNAVLPEDREPLSQEEIEHAFSRKKRKEIYARSLDRFSKPEGDTLPQPIVVGLESLRRRNMRIGDVVTLVSFSPYDYEPKSQTFLVVGAFRTGMNDTEQWIYMPIRSAQVFLDLYNDVLNEFTFSGISVKLDDYSYADEVAAKIESLDSDYGAQMPGLGLRAYTWEQMRSTLLAAVDVEKRIIFAMMLLIVAFAGAMIFLILALMAIEKTRDIGVLQSLGATPRGLVMIFMRLGVTLTVGGIVFGVAAGWLFTENINAIENLIQRTTGFELFPANIYFFTEIPVRRTTFDLLLIVGTAFGFGLLGSFVPAMWAARKDPVKTLRYE